MNLRKRQLALNWVRQRVESKYRGGSSRISYAKLAYDINKQLNLKKSEEVGANTLLKFFRDYQGLRSSKTLDLLMKFFEAPYSEITNSLYNKELPDDLVSFIGELWDGTPQHIQRMKQLLIAAHSINRQPY